MADPDAATVEWCAEIARDHTPSRAESTLAAHITGRTIEREIRALRDQPPGQTAIAEAQVTLKGYGLDLAEFAKQQFVRAEAAEKRIAELEGALREAGAVLKDAPVVVIDVPAARSRGESELVWYAEQLSIWAPRARQAQMRLATLATKPEEPT